MDRDIYKVRKIGPIPQYFIQ